MKKKWTLMCILHLFCGACLDYVDPSDKTLKVDLENLPPIIDMQHISPHPTRLPSSISVGKKCKGQSFQVPPIYDRNKDDPLHCLWFMDGRLAKPLSTVEPGFRHAAISTLGIDAQFLMAHFDSRIPNDFFDKPHLIEFFVSDLPYKIPESRYIDESAENEKNHGDYAYWIVSFNNDPC